MKTCLICGKTLAKRGQKKVCSWECNHELKRRTPSPLKGYTFSEEARTRMSKGRIGMKLSEAHKRAIGDSLRGRVGKRLSRETRAKISAIQRGRRGKPCSPETRRKISIAQKGERSHNWQGGKTKENRRIYNSVEYRLWREAVFKRDNYTCQFCNKKGGTVNADHILPFAHYPSLRFELSNGRTLCVECHRKTPTYGWSMYNQVMKGKAVEEICQ